MPDSVTIARVEWDGNVYKGKTEIATGVGAMILQEGEDTEMLMMGVYDASSIVMIVEPTVEINAGDLVIDERNAVEYRVARPPSTHRNPLTWEDHHKEVLMERHEHRGN